VIVPDATRDARLDRSLPVILDRLHRGGIADRKITLLVACGTHPSTSASAVQKLFGALPDGLSLIQHDARDSAQLVPVGKLPTGSTIRLHRRAVDADLLVTIGAVRHHYFAGFGGGPKMVFPGVSGYEEIQANHARVMSSEGAAMVRHPRCEPGLLEGNPVAEEIRLAAELRPPDCAVCLVPGKGGGFAAAVAGRWTTAFAAAVLKIRDWYEIGAEAFRLIVASGGGHPSDTTLIQAHKGLDAACRFLSEGGEMLYVAGISEGSGSPEMESFLADPRPDAIVDRLAKTWVQYGHTTLRLVEKTDRHRIYIHSMMNPELASRLGMRPTNDPAEVISDWRVRFPGETVGVVPVETVYPRLQD
jgi:nickel-dependent lactate racemase